MDFLLDPNIAYLFLLGGVLLGLMAIITPGTGMFEVGSFFCLALAGYAVYNLSFNLWALIVLVLSIIPFVYAIQKPKRERFSGALDFGLGRGFGIPVCHGWLATGSQLRCWRLFLRCCMPVLSGSLSEKPCRLLMRSPHMTFPLLLDK